MSGDKKQFKKIDVEKLESEKKDIGSIDKLKFQHQSISLDIAKTLNGINGDIERKKKIKL
jgi:hypothetical protein